MHTPHDFRKLKQDPEQPIRYPRNAGRNSGYAELGQALPDLCPAVRFFEIVCESPVRRMCAKATLAELTATQKSDMFYPIVLISELSDNRSKHNREKSFTNDEGKRREGNFYYEQVTTRDQQ